MELNELKAGLAMHTGTESYHRHPLSRKFVLTDGAVWLAENAGAWWLLDVIVSHQHDARAKREEFQVWTLIKDKIGEGCVVHMTDGNSAVPIITQVIEFTDFPLDEIKFYVCLGDPSVVMLTSEY